jgi:hypothetical protein
MEAFYRRDVFFIEYTEDRRAHSRESCMLQGRRILAGIS